MEIIYLKRTGTGIIVKLPVPPKICNFHYPFEIKAWYICFISLLYKFKTNKISHKHKQKDLALQQRNPSALTEWHAQEFRLQLQLHNVICQNIVQILIRKILEIQSLCKIHQKIHTKAELEAMKSSGLCNTFKTNMIAGRNVWLAKNIWPETF